MTWLRCVLFISGFLVPVPCSAGTIVQRKGAATLEVRYEPQQPHLTLADTITVTLSIEGSMTWEITAPRALPAAAKWLLIEPPKTKSAPLPKGNIRWQRIYRVALREPGPGPTYQVPFVFPEVKIRIGEMEEQNITWDPIEFVVTPQIAQPDRAAMRDITSIEEAPAAPAVPESSWHWALPTGAFVLLIAVLYGLHRILRRKQPRSPKERALYEWERLHAMQLPQHGRSERFITLLTMLLRDFLERECQRPARRQTTQELLHSLTQDACFTGAEQHFLAEFLQRAEEVKFAHVVMSVEQCRQWGQKVRHFLEQHGNVPDTQVGQANETLPVDKFGQSG